MTFRPTILLLALLALSACGQSDTQPAPKLFKEQREALDKAKAVAPALQKQEEEQKKAVEEQAQ